MRDRARIALACLVASLSCNTSAATDDAYPLRTRVLAALQEIRPFDLRLASTQPYRSCQTPDTGSIRDRIACPRANDREALSRAATLSIDVAAKLASDPTTDALWSAALLDVWSADAGGAAVDRAIVRLLEVAARERGRRRAAALNDLAIAHAVRAAARSNVGDLFAALDFAERAVRSDSTLVVARYNRAALLDGLRIDTQAADAWRALSSERNAWGREAETRARVLADRIEGAGTGFGATSDDSLEHRASEAPQRAREYVLDTLIGMWAHAPAERDALRRRAERIGNALVARNGDSSVAHIAAELASDEPFVAAVATGAKGWTDYLQTRYLDAQPELESSIRELRAMRAPALSDWLEVTLAGLQIQRAKYAVAERLFDEIASRATKRHDIALEARARWGLTLSLARRGAMTDGELSSIDASRQFDRIGEAGNAAFLKTISSEIRHSLGREDASDRDLYDALTGFHARPKPGQRYALLLVIGTRLSERGLQHASAAMIREAVLEAAMTGRAKDLPEALTRLATAESNLGETGAAKQTIARVRELLPRIPDSVMHSRLDAELARTEARVYGGEDRNLALDRLGTAIGYFSATGIPTDEANLRVDRASLLLSLGDSAGAERDLANATSMAATYIGRTPSRAASRVWLSTQRHAYHQLASIALARGDTSRAYEYTRYGRKSDRRELAGAPTLVEYAVLDQKTLIWTTSNGTRRLTVAPAGDSSLSDLVGRFTNLVRQNEDTLAEAALGNRLYALLVAPVRASMGRRAVIVSDGPLNGLPFAALRDSSGKYLIEDVALAYSDGRVDGRRDSDGRAFADALFVGSPSWDRGLFPELEPLREIEREVAEASALYPRHAVLGDSAASRASVVKRLASHDVVHFAGHARVVDDNPRASHLVLAKEPGGFSANVLSASDIAAMRLSRVRLVVLSACGSTGARFGRSTSNGLVEAFLDAGVGGVIANDWEADDAGTAALTPVLHRELRNGAAPDEALRRAQVAMLRAGDRRFSSPAVWAGFRVVSG